MTNQRVVAMNLIRSDKRHFPNTRQYINYASRVNKNVQLYGK